MSFYVAADSSGQRHRADSREEIDRWAAHRCAAGQSVDVYARAEKTWHAKVGSAPILVGRWEPAR